MSSPTSGTAPEPSPSPSPSPGPSLSPSSLRSPSKRPQISDRLLSANSLSPTAKHVTYKAHRYHAGGGGTNRLHTRNTSYGRGLGKAGKITSGQNLVEDGARHQRSKSNTSIPVTSPQAAAVKRNGSHVSLAKNTSHANLRKNKSANALARNLSHTHLARKVGLGPAAPKPRKKASKKHQDFVLANMSSDEETEEADEEAQWEDSNSQSPKLTRTNSAVSTQPRPGTTAHRAVADQAAEPSDGTWSSPEPSIRPNRSAPNFRASSTSPGTVADAATKVTPLQHPPRSSGAPTAVSSISAQAFHNPLLRHNSSFTRTRYMDTTSSTLVNTPNTPKSAIGSSSADGGVSHFLPITQSPSGLRQQRRGSSGSDHGSPSSFVPQYHSQPSSSPEKSRSHVSVPMALSAAKAKEPYRSSSHLPSRTQQRLELQRRETMRAAGPTSPSTPLLADGHGGSAAVSLHGHSGSHGRNRGADPSSAVSARLTTKQDCEAAERQLAVVKRFRNPIVEAVGRLKESKVLGLEKGVGKSAHLAGGGGSGRMAGFRRNGGVKSEANLMVGGGARGRGAGPVLSPPAPGWGGKGQLRRQGSHDEVGLSRSQGSHDEVDGDGGEGDGEGGAKGAGDGGMSAEMEMMRRMWESREVYEKGEGQGEEG